MPRFLSTTPSSAEHPPDPLPATSNTVVILAAMLCALICLVGLALVALCSWIRRRTSPPPPPPPPPPKKGLKKKAIRSLPKLLFGGERIADCPICLAEFVEGDEIRILPECGHGFHVGCVDTWLRAHSSCPSCRRVLVIPPPSDSDRAVDGGGKVGDGNRFLL